MSGASELDCKQEINFLKTSSSKYLALWWRGTIDPKAKKEIKLLPPYTPYNLFDYYCTQGSRDTRSLPYLFANTDCRDFDTVMRFSEYFGLIGKWTFSEEAAHIISRQKDFGGESLHGDTEERISQNTQDLVLQLQLAQLTHFHARSGYLKLFQQTQKKLIKILSRIEKAQSDADARDMLPKRLMKWHKMCPQIAWDNQEKCWSTIWHLPSLEAGIYLMLHIDLQRGGLIRSCRRTDCSRWFRTNHPIITFCSLRCQNTNKVREYRQRKKDKPSPFVGA